MENVLTEYFKLNNDFIIITMVIKYNVFKINFSQQNH